MNHLDLFSGIGGFALAAEWAGFETAMFCEVDPFCREVLGKHWPHVPIHDDIRTLTADVVGQPIDLLTGGFPCQPFSFAGKRRGADDDRHLWPEMARIIGECRPRWVLGENTPGLISLGIDDCLDDLEGLGYEAWPVVVPACGVGAWHPRARVWIVAHAGRELLQGSGVVGATPRATDRSQGSTVPDADQSGRRTGKRSLLPWTRKPDVARGGWWDVEPAVGRVAHGIPRRVDRLRSLGNAIVPQVAYVILQSMLEAEAA